MFTVIFDHINGGTSTMRNVATLEDAHKLTDDNPWVGGWAGILIGKGDSIRVIYLTYKPTHYPA